jgi:hypothetical protein
LHFGNWQHWHVGSGGQDGDEVEIEEDDGEAV